MAEAYTGFDTVSGGMNNLFAPDLIGVQNYAKAINVFTRGGKAQTRPGFGVLEPTGTEDHLARFKAGPWQGASIYRYMGRDYLIMAAGGRIYTLNLDTMALYEFAVIMDAFAERMWFCQADNYMLVQDGLSRPAIIQGSQIEQSNTDALTDDEGDTIHYLPVGRAMTYGHGRLFVQVTDRLFLAGDICLPWKPESILKFDETYYFAGGGALSIPACLGDITALIIQQNVVTGTGLGPLLAFCENGVSAFAINTLRSEWATTDISQVVFTNAGAVGQDAVLAVNNDIIFRGWDGVRTIKHTASELSGGSILRNMPFSETIEGIMREDARAMLPHVSMALFDNRLFCVTGGEVGYMADAGRNRIARQYLFNGIVSADLRNPNNIAWESVLTGLKVKKIFTARQRGEERLFVIAHDEEADENVIYAMDEHAYGRDGVNCIPTVSRLYTRSFDFSGTNMPLGAVEKRFVSADFDLKDIRGDVTVRLLARATGQAVWQECGKFALKAGMNMEAGQTLHPQAFRKQRIEAPLADGMDADGRSLLNGKAFEFCIEWTGHLVIDKVIFKAALLTQEADTPTENPEETQLEGLSLYDFDYSIERGGA